jgi:hypothetical protein
VRFRNSPSPEVSFRSVTDSVTNQTGRPAVRFARGNVASAFPMNPQSTMLEPVLVGPSFKLPPPQQIRLEAVAWIRSRIRILSPTSREVAEVRLSCLEQSHGALPGPLDREALYYTAVHLERCPHPLKQLHQPKHRLPLCSVAPSRPRPISIPPCRQRSTYSSRVSCSAESCIHRTAALVVGRRMFPQSIGGPLAGPSWSLFHHAHSSALNSIDSASGSPGSTRSLTLRSGTWRWPGPNPGQNDRPGCRRLYLVPASPPSPRAVMSRRYP